MSSVQPPAAEDRPAKAQAEDTRAAEVLKDEGYKMVGNAPVYAILREAKDREGFEITQPGRGPFR